MIYECLNYMEILFGNTGQEADWDDSRLLVRKHNAQRAKLIRRRLDDLKAVANLAVMRDLPGRCHALTSKRKHQFSIDLDGPYRLIFKPGHDPLPLKDDGGLDWERITAIVLLGVENTHE
jgi:proteic killer suppression protein